MDLLLEVAQFVGCLAPWNASQCCIYDVLEVIREPMTYLTRGGLFIAKAKSNQ